MPGEIKIDDGAGNYTILTNAGSLGSDKTITIPNETATLATTTATEIDVWALTADIAGTNADITSNLARATGTNVANKGTGMTQSSGVFTFPSTGYWQVTAKGYITVNADTSAVIAIKTTNNNSTYSNVSYTGGGERSANDAVFNIETSIILEIDDTSNDKVKFATSSLVAGSTVHGTASGLETRFTFVKLGDL